MGSSSIYRKNWKSAFTLVELIVVITILAILGTVGFLSLQGYSAGVRDSARISNLSNLQKGLVFWKVVTGTFPMPENAVVLTASGVPIGYQGFARDQIARLAKLSPNSTRDPVDPGMYTTYAVSAGQTNMQVMAFLEDGSKASSIGIGSEMFGIDTAYAGSSDYSTRTPASKGDTLGILLGNGSIGTILNQPIQETGSGVDILNTGSGYAMIFSNTDKISGTWSTLRAGIGWGWLVGYWSFDEGNGNTVRDAINNIQWTLTGKTIWDMPLWTVWKIWNAMSFNGNGMINFWEISEKLKLSTFSISFWTYVNGTWNTIIMEANSNFGYSSQLSGKWYLALNIWWYKAGKQILSSNPYEINQWQHVTFVTDWNTGKVYVDSANKTQQNTTNWPAVYNGWAFTIWARNGISYWFNWLIDEVRIYNRVLSDYEIAALYKATR